MVLGLLDPNSGIPQGSRISECEGAWEFQTLEFLDLETSDEYE